MIILIGILTVILILVSFFLILIVLAQKAKNDGGMGAAMGGGMAEAAFGAETSNVLSKSTIYAAIAFFVLALILYLTRLHQQKPARADHRLEAEIDDKGDQRDCRNVGLQAIEHDGDSRGGS